MRLILQFYSPDVQCVRLILQFYNRDVQYVTLILRLRSGDHQPLRLIQRACNGVQWRCSSCEINYPTVPYSSHIQFGTLLLWLCNGDVQSIISIATNLQRRCFRALLSRTSTLTPIMKKQYRLCYLDFKWSMWHLAATCIKAFKVTTSTIWECRASRLSLSAEQVHVVTFCFRSRLAHTRSTLTQSFTVFVGDTVNTLVVVSLLRLVTTFRTSKIPTDTFFIGTFYDSRVRVVRGD